MSFLLGGAVCSAGFGKPLVHPLCLQKDLVAIVVLRLPATLTDGAAGVGQERDQLAYVLDSELQHRGVGGHRVLVTGQSFQGELDVYIQIGENGEDAEVRFPLAGAPA